MVLTAGVGTLKRKQQLRDLMEQHEADNEDNLCDTTPFKTMLQNKVGSLFCLVLFISSHETKSQVSFTDPTSSVVVCRSSFVCMLTFH